MTKDVILRYLLIGIFLVATATGLNVIFQGIAGIPESGLITQASVDNELRFMAVFWVAFGVYCLMISRNVHENKKNIGFVAIVFLCSGVARLLSFVTVGQPIELFIGAMAVELVLPVVLFVLLSSLNGQDERQLQPTEGASE